MNDLPVVLLVFANHIDPEYRLTNLSRERNEIRKLLKYAERIGLCEVVVLIDPNYNNLIEIFHDQKFKDRISILHFAGHANAERFSLESLEGKPELVFTAGFAKFLGAQKSLKLVFLNACETGQHAQYLHDAGIPFVLSTGREVDDTFAANIAIRFYQSLAADKTINNAYKELVGIFEGMDEYKANITRGLGFRSNSEAARDYKLTSPSNQDNPFEWCFSVAKNDPLFNLPTDEDLVFPEIPFIGPRPYSTNDVNIFWGRDYEIKRFYNLLQEIDPPSLIVCHGVNGVGKTSFLCAGLIPRLIKKGYSTYSIYLDHTCTARSFRLTLTGHLSDIESNKEKSLIIIFGLHQGQEFVVKEIQEVIKNTSIEFNIILEMDNHLLMKWQSLFKKFIPYLFHLPPFSARDIASILDKLTKMPYNVSLESKFKESFTSLILSDPNSGISPILQFTLKTLYKQAKKLNINAPKLDQSLFVNWNSSQGFSAYLEYKLSNIDSKFISSGLVLEFLNECIPYNKLEKLPRLEDIKNEFGASSELMDLLHNQLRANYLISEPVSFEADDFLRNRLYHDVLVNPIKDIIDNSNHPVQKIRRLFKYVIQGDKLFDQKEVDLINQNKLHAKVMNQEEDKVLHESTSFLDDQKKRERYKSYFKYSLAFTILFLGILIDSPYLLMYLILLFVFYFFDRTPRQSPFKNE